MLGSEENRCALPDTSSNARNLAKECQNPMRSIACNSNGKAETLIPRMGKLTAYLSWWYFRSRCTKAGRVPSSTVMLNVLVFGFSNEPLV